MIIKAQRKNQKAVNFKLNTAIIKKIDMLIPKIVTNSELAPRGKVSRSDVMRLAIEKGLPEIEKLIPPESED